MSDIGDEALHDAEELNAHGGLSALSDYKKRKVGDNPSARARAIFAGVCLFLIVALMGKCAADDSANGVHSASAPTTAAAPPATAGSTTQALTTTVAPTTTADPTTTAAPTTSPPPPTTTAAVTTAVAIAPETLAAYTAASNYHDDSLRQIVPDLDVAGLQVYCDEAAQIDGQFIQDLTTNTFGPAVQPLVDKLIATLMATQQNEQNCARASNAQAANALWSEPSTLDAAQAAIDAETAVRAALGVPPLAG